MGEPVSRWGEAAGILLGVVPFGKALTKWERVGDFGGHVLNSSDSRLANQLVSQEGVAELLSSGGRPISGAGINVPIRDVGRLVNDYGGSASDWSKVTSTAPGHLQTHDNRNVVKGEVVEIKSKLP